MAQENSKNTFQSTVDSLFKGMDGFMTTKTVVGEAMTVGDTIILPLVDVSFGVAATAKSDGGKNGGGGGIGGKMTPSAVLVIKDDTAKLVNVKNQDSMTKILDMVPDFVNRFTSGTGFSENTAKSDAKSGQEDTASHSEEQA